MEKNHDTLQKAISKLAAYEPGEEIWSALNENLAEQPLKGALKQLPEYEPDEMLWDMISRKTTGKPSFTWSHAAVAMVVLGLSLGLVIYNKNSQQQVSYSIEKVDSRLQNEDGQVTDSQYQRLKAYCEMETLVCTSKDYKRLQEEYEKLNEASVQLRQAIGEYNTEVELVRQVTILEEQKADVLNEMAKMI